MGEGSASKDAPVKDAPDRLADGPLGRSRSGPLAALFCPPLTNETFAEVELTGQQEGGAGLRRMRTSEEVRQLREIEREVAAAFPDIPEDKIKTAVDQHWLDLLHAPVRDYVPVLVRRLAIDDLRQIT